MRNAVAADYDRIAPLVDECWGRSWPKPDEAYIHFVGVSPDHRRRGIGRLLYERLFAAVRAQSRSIVRCVTAPINERSVAFHRALGFEVDRVAKGYDGRGGDRVLMSKQL